MKPAVVMPMHDPLRIFFPHLKVLTPTLKTIFERAYISVPYHTREAQPENMAWLQTQDFFQVLYHDQDLAVGVDFLALYNFAASTCPSEQILHLCFIDRVAFALQTEFRASFIADLQSLTHQDVPLIFHRSAAAWQTHPANYMKLEQIVTTVGEYLFAKTLDFAWCHLVVQASQLRQILPFVTRPEISMVAELILHLKESIQSKDVDWLAWEDPFIYGHEAIQLRHERENSPLETQKRLGYVIPMLQLLEAAIESN